MAAGLANVTLPANSPTLTVATDADSAPPVIDLTFEEAFDALYGRAYGVGYQIIGRRAEAEDVAQEALARALLRWSRVRDHAEAWVVRVAGNLAYGWWRKNGRLTSLVEQPSLATPGPSGERIDLIRALRRLSKRQREVVMLRYVADLPEADVAAALGCSVGTVKQHASRGLASLRARMQSIGPSDGGDEHDDPDASSEAEAD